jgi:hypothetical protein
MRVKKILVLKRVVFSSTMLVAASLLASCATTSTDAKVQTSLSSKDGYAECPSNTTVVGGGYEIEDAYQMPDRMPVVVKNQPYANGWRVMCTDSKGIMIPGCKAWVVCATVLR